MNNFNLLKDERPNKRNSRRLLGIIMYTAIAGISFRFAYDNITPTKINTPSPNIEIQSETTPTPTIVESELTASGSSIEALSGSDMLSISERTLIPSLNDLVSCGVIDSDGDGLVDDEDFSDFQKIYKKTCMIETLQITDNCGVKDFNNDNVLNMSDLLNFSEKFRLNKC